MYMTYLGGNSLRSPSLLNIHSKLVGCGLESTTQDNSIGSSTDAPNTCSSSDLQTGLSIDIIFVNIPSYHKKVYVGRTSKK